MSAAVTPLIPQWKPLLDAVHNAFAKALSMNF